MKFAKASLSNDTATVGSWLYGMQQRPGTNDYWTSFPEKESLMPSRHVKSPASNVKPEANGGRACVVVSNNPARRLPAESKPVAVNAKLKRLLFLHSAAWVNEKEKRPAGEYVVTYASGRRAVIPIIAGENIGDWWGASAKKQSNCECAWSGMNRHSTVGVYLFEWSNPHPEDPIRDIVLKAKNHAVVGLVGLTGEREK